MLNWIVDLGSFKFKNNTEDLYPISLRSQILPFKETLDLISKVPDIFLQYQNITLEVVVLLEAFGLLEPA